jgi:hypothetical protein
MRKHLFAMASVSVLGLATAIGTAGAFTLTPIGSDTNVIQVKDRGEMGRGGGSGRGAVSGRSGGDVSVRSGGGFRGGTQIQRNTGPRVSSGNRVTRSRGDDGRRAITRSRSDDGRRVITRSDSQFSRDVSRGQHRHVRRGWSRDRRHIFYGAVLVGVPFGYAVYDSHPCYDWLAGPQGVGYYWNYYRCPV